MSSLRIVISIAITAAVFFSSSALAEEDPFASRLLPLELVMEYRKQIDLTQAQQKKIGEYVVATQQAVVASQWEMRAAYFDLLEALDEEKIDEQSTLTLMESAVNAENKIKVEQVRLLIKIRNLLNASQITFLKARLNEGWSEDEN